MSGLLISLFLLFGHQTKAPVPSFPAPPISAALLNQMRNETVLISNEGFGGTSRGTGVLIDATHVLTCAHVVSSGEMWVYTYPVSRVLLAHPVYVDRLHDLAIVELNRPVMLAHYAVIQSSVAVGEPIIVIGNTLGAMKWFVSYGLISETDGIYALTTATIHGGNSGGPWMNLKGEVVALTDWALEDRHGRELGISGGINGDIIQKALRAWKSPNILQLLFGGSDGRN